MISRRSAAFHNRQDILIAGYIERSYCWDRQIVSPATRLASIFISTSHVFVSTLSDRLLTCYIRPLPEEVLQALDKAWLVSQQDTPNYWHLDLSEFEHLSIGNPTTNQKQSTLMTLDKRWRVNELDVMCLAGQELRHVL